MGNAKRDDNHLPTLLGVSSVDNKTPIPIQVNPITGRVLVNVTGGTSPLTSKGDIYTNNGTIDVRLGVGADGTVLSADSTAPEGIKWSSAGAGDVVGPASAVDSNFASYNGITGKLIKDSGSNSSSFDPAGSAATAESNANAYSDGLASNYDPAGSAATAQSNAETYADSLVVGLLDDRGNYDASGNVYPSTGGSGTAGAILKGDLWTISVIGTLGGVDVTVGDVVRALTDTPGQTSTNWVITENNIGYVAENSANKKTDLDANKTSNIFYASCKAIYDWAVGLFVQINGALGTPSSGTATNITGLPAAGVVNTAATLTDTQTLTNKTLTDPKIITAINTQTGLTYTLVLTDASKSILANNAASQAYTIPTNASVAFPIGTTLIVTQYGAGYVTLTGDTGVTVNGISAGGMSTNAQYGTLALEKIGTNEWLVLGGMGIKTINAQTGTTYTLALTDSIEYTQLVTLSNAGAIALTVPTNATVPFAIGTQIDITQQGAGAVTISGAGVTLNSKGAALTTNGQYVGVSLIKIATDTWNVYGDLV